MPSAREVRAPKAVGIVISSHWRSPSRDLLRLSALGDEIEEVRLCFIDQGGRSPPPGEQARLRRRSTLSRDLASSAHGLLAASLDGVEPVHW